MWEPWYLMILNNLNIISYHKDIMFSIWVNNMMVVEKLVLQFV
jgi:hypothetical protein